MNTADKIEKCSQCKHLCLPNTPFRYTGGVPFCEEGSGEEGFRHERLTIENVTEKKPDNCPMKGKDERY